MRLRKIYYETRNQAVNQLILIDQPNNYLHLLSNYTYLSETTLLILRRVLNQYYQQQLQPR